MLIKRYKAIAMIIGLTTLLGQVSIHPFNTAFRFGLGPLIFAFLILIKRKHVNSIVVGVLTGFFVLLFRSGIGLIQGVEFTTGLKVHFPAMIYYIAMGTGFNLIKLSRFVDRPFVLGSFLAVVDFGSNVIEILIRGLMGEDVSFFPVNLAIVAVLRMCISSGVYTMLNYQKLKIIHSMEKKNYENLLIKTSSLYSEIFFLETTGSLIEEIMVKSYSLYNTLSNSRDLQVEKYSKHLLNITTDIHEIKKHYNRIATGLRKLLDEHTLDQAVNKFSQVVQVLCEANRDYSRNLGKEIEFNINLETDIELNNLFAIVAILNNLVSNAIEAIKDKGSIGINQWVERENILILVEDDGKGIDKKNLGYIFDIGFTTKYDPTTGKSSTGIGLVHVKSLVEQLGGCIEVDSELGKGTKFKISLPRSAIQKGERL